MGRKNYKALGLVFTAMLWLAACVKDKPATPAIETITATQKVYIICEGSLSYGNSSLALYDAEKGTAYDDVYKNSNGEDLGDVFQSMIEIDGRLFLCINNSDKIVVLDKNTYKLIHTINMPKPRYILPVGGDKAYVSTLFSNKVYIINTQTMEQTGIINMPALNPEGMLLHNGSAYVCCWDTASDKVYKINPSTDEIADEIKVAGRAPQEILEDKDHNLWVLSGNEPKKKNGAFTCIDGTNGLQIKAYHFPEKADAIKPVFNNTKDIIYFLAVNHYGGMEYNGVYRMHIYDATLPTQPMIAAEQYQYFWALGVEPGTDHIYLGDPKGFTQKGSVQVYEPNGTFVKQWATGVGPGRFYFRNN